MSQQPGEEEWDEAVSKGREELKTMRGEMDVSAVGRASNGDLMRQRESVSFNETTFFFLEEWFTFCKNHIIW